MGFLRDIFGPSKEEIWTQIAKDIDGKYEDGGFLGTDVLRYHHKQWEVLLDTYSTGGKNKRTYTRLRVPFLNKNDLFFEIYREHFFTPVGKFFGMQDIQIGDTLFDDNYVIKGNNEYIIKKLLRDKELKKLFDSLPKVNVKIKNGDGWFADKYPEGVNILNFESIGVIKEKVVLRNLFELFSAILDRLVHIDAAYKEDPKFKLW